MNVTLLSLLVVTGVAGCQAGGPPPRAQNLDFESRARIVSSAVAAEREGRYADCAELRIDGISKGMTFPENYLNVARCLARAGDRERALEYLGLAFEKGLRIPREQLERDDAFATLRSDSRFAARLARASSTAAPVGDEALRQELLAMRRADQSARAGHRSAGVEAEPAIRKLDLERAARLDAIVARVGWPGKSLVGDDGASAAWLILQHSTPELMKRCLPLVEAAVDRGEASRSELAYLTDRILVIDGKPQRYGTQLVRTETGLVPAPIEDETHVDARRAAVGLGPLSDYVADSNAALSR